MQVRPRRRFVITTDSDHDQPIFPNVAKALTPDGPDQLWVADITYVQIAIGFVYLAVILDAWSRRVIGYALGRTIEARLTVAELEVAKRPGVRRQGAFTIPIAAASMPLSATANCWQHTACSVQWGDAPIRMTTPRPRAS